MWTAAWIWRPHPLVLPDALVSLSHTTSAVYLLTSPSHYLHAKLQKYASSWTGQLQLMRNDRHGPCFCSEIEMIFRGLHWLRTFFYTKISSCRFCRIKATWAKVKKTNSYSRFKNRKVLVDYSYLICENIIIFICHIISYLFVISLHHFHKHLSKWHSFIVHSNWLQCLWSFFFFFRGKFIWPESSAWRMPLSKAAYRSSPSWREAT